jgi:exopolyphosphatase/pppGpp-phosphohydrolase
MEGRYMRPSSFLSKAMITLHIGEQQSQIVSQADRGEGVEHSLPLGSVKIAEAFFKPYPPRPLNLENAIAAVEDELFKLRHLAAEMPRSVLQSSNGSIRQIALACGVGAGAVLAADAVERAFNDLVALSAGGRSAFVSAGGDAAPWALDARSGAVLLILREFLHHMKFDAIRVLDVNN